jgi:Ca2+-binding EF-hand superfamily protein
MRWFVLPTVIMCFCFSGAAFAAGPQTIDPKTVMDSCDRNLDGHIDRDEYHSRLTEVFFIVDVDKDGKLTLTEILAAYPDVKPERVKAADRNSDGMITIYEFHEVLVKDFNAADKDKDGTLNGQETAAMLEDK